MDIGAFAFSAHLQKDSLEAKLGDRVKTGKRWSLFGLPYVFTRFTEHGTVGKDEGFIVTGKPAKIDASKRAGPHADQLPLNNHVMDFQ